MITLASDFGAPYPAAMRGVILDRTDEAATLVDLTHTLPRQDVRTAAFWLQELIPWYPPAVHCAVIDPGVGTDRSAIAFRVGDHALVGPDNGLLVPAAHRLNGTIEAFEIINIDPASSTFHGRDIFAPVAADIDTVGVDAMSTLETLSATQSFVDLTLPEPTINASADAATGEILAIDDFGNAITNVPGDALNTPAQLAVEGMTVPFVDSFAHVAPGQALVTVGSHGNLELAVNQGRGADAFEVAVGDTVTIEAREE